ncbi:conserved hypothetical protein [Treponema pallidum subsp. pallidum str. Chicago]|nr:conserved hypothetical protein [Treponema pallidum subsp. pallidum str. Chicago]
MESSPKVAQFFAQLKNEQHILRAERYFRKRSTHSHCPLRFGF